MGMIIDFPSPIKYTAIVKNEMLINLNNIFIQIFNLNFKIKWMIIKLSNNSIQKEY